MDTVGLLGEDLGVKGIFLHPDEESILRMALPICIDLPINQIAGGQYCDLDGKFAVLDRLKRLNLLAPVRDYRTKSCWTFEFDKGPLYDEYLSYRRGEREDTDGEKQAEAAKTTKRYIEAEKFIREGK